MSDTVRLEDRICTLCGPEAHKLVKYPANFSEEDLNAAIFSARRMPDRRHFRLVECASCQMIYSDPATDASNLAKLYLQSAVTYDRQEEQIYESYAPILDRALPKLAKRGTFVEIGGGRGFMLKYGAQNGFAEQIEIEPSSDAEKKFEPASSRARFVRDIFREGTVPGGSVSLACFFQVLDHIPDPKGFLESVYGALEPGGAAVCVTHDTSAWSAKLLGERSPIFDIEHTYLFNRRNLPELFRKAGFRDVDVFPVANRYALKYWLHMAPLPKALKAPLQKLFAATGLSERRVNLYAGNFGVIGYR